MKLKIQSLFEIKDELYLILINLVLLFISLATKELWLIVLLCFCLFKTFKSYFKVGLMTILIILIIICNLSIFYFQNQKASDLYSKELNQRVAKIVKITLSKDSQKLVLKIDNLQFISYLYEEHINEHLTIGTKLLITGTIEEVAKPNLEDSFNYQKYLYYQKISGFLKLHHYEVIKTGKSLKNIHLMVSKYYDNYFDEQTSSFLKALVIGDKTSLDGDIKEGINEIGISHLFVVSGLHVSMIIMIISFILNKLKVKAKTSNYLILAFLILYLFITNFLISVIRVFISFVLTKLKTKLNSFNQFSLNAILVMIIFPHQVFTYAFILSYLISGTIILSKNILKDKKAIFQMFIISFLSLMVTLPIIATINGSINFLSLIYNLFYIPFISYLVLPFSILVSFVPILAFIYKYVITIFLILTNFFKNIKIFSFIFPKLPFIFIFCYYLLIYLLFVRIEQKAKIFKIAFILFIFLFLWNNKIYFNLSDKIEFLNVQVGDATLIQTAFNQTTILIDTGEKAEIVTYLKQKGIKKIDYLFISHGDADHMGQLSEIIANVKVKNILISEYDINTLNVLKKLKIPAYLKVNFLRSNLITKTFKVIMLGPFKDYGNTNDNSLVFILEIAGLKILFTGDISIKVEKELIDNYPNLAVNILKVPHHGSKTSSSSDFLENLRFDIAVAMNGSNNTFGFPHQEVIKRYESRYLYNTCEYGTIKFTKYFFEKHF